MTTPQSNFEFTVTVTVNDTGATFTIYDSAGKPFTGEVDVQVANSTIKYTLQNCPKGMYFVDPTVEQSDTDVTYEIATDKNEITFTDTDANEGVIKIYLKTQLGTNVYTSPDPQVRNKKRI